MLTSPRLHLSPLASEVVVLQLLPPSFCLLTSHALFCLRNITVCSCFLDSSLQSHLLSWLTLAHLSVGSLGKFSLNPRLVPFAVHHEITQYFFRGPTALITMCLVSMPLLDSMSNGARNHLFLVHCMILR